MLPMVALLVIVLAVLITRGDTVVTAKGDNRIRDAEERARDSVWRIW